MYFEGMKPLLFSFAMLLVFSACRTERRDEQPRETAVQDESALQEYVNEPKRRAQDVKSDMEAAQQRAHDQALEASGDEVADESEDE